MKRILLSILASGVYAGAMAVPAKPGLGSFTQPDGSIVKIKVVGDEHGHMLYTESGLLLVEANGRLEYAQFDETGHPRPSGIMATADGESTARSLNLQTESRLERWAERLNTVRAARLAKPLAEQQILLPGTRGQGEEEELLVPKYFARCESTFPTLGEQKALVILVEYADVSFEYGDYDYFHRMLNEEGFSDYGSFGSVRDWFIENSDGKFLPEFDVVGPVKLPKNRAYYGENDSFGNDAHPYDMLIDACDMIDGELDFTQYDRDGDGKIDNVFLFYAGKGEHDSPLEKDLVWPHSWDLSIALPEKEFIYDGVILDHYACTCEYPSGYQRPDGIGTFVHEFSHVLGLPDLYPTIQTSSFTPGEWSVMDQGPYNNDRLTPPNYSSYEKCALGWIDMKSFTPGRMEIPDLTESNVAYALPTDKETEFYFFENRQQRGNDTFLPGHGMLVWHIDYRPAVWTLNTVNNTPMHQYVDLVEADNIRSSGSVKADSFPGSKNITKFGFDTKPSLASWSKQRLAYDLEDIAESEEGLISFNAVLYEENAVGEIEISGEEGAYYDLMGRRIANPSRGIYIHNGRKILIKD